MTDLQLLTDMRRYAKAEWIPILREDSEEFLIKILKEKQPKSCLELGTGMGYSSILFSSVLDDKIEIDTVEKDPERINLAKKYISLSKKENIHIYEGYAELIIKHLQGPYDFVFIDANKSKILEYFKQALVLSSERAFIVIDNVALEGETFSKKYPAHKHRTSIYRTREFVKLLKVNPSNTAPVELTVFDTHIKVSYYPFGDGLLLIERD